MSIKYMKNTYEVEFETGAIDDMEYCSMDQEDILTILENNIEKIVGTECAPTFMLLDEALICGTKSENGITVQHIIAGQNLLQEC